VGQAAALEGQPGHPDGGLVGDEDDVLAGELVPDGGHDGVDPLDHVDVALAPGGGAQVAQLPPDLGMAQDVPGDVAGDPFEDVAGLDQPQVGAELQAVGGRDRGGGLLGPLQGAGPHRGQRDVGEVAGQQARLGLAAGRQAVAGQPAVEHPAGILHLPVADQVDDGLGHALASAPVLEVLGWRVRW
jgi:hypothetical protein